jgi:hypothetical protein
MKMMLSGFIQLAANMAKMRKYLSLYFDISYYDIYLIYVFKRASKGHYFGYNFKIIVGTGAYVWV